jgi:hypothetical protein
VCLHFRFRRHSIRLRLQSTVYHADFLLKDSVMDKKCRIQYFLVRGEHQDLRESDLILLEGAHVVVLEWADPPHNEQPSIYLPLDPEHLRAPSEADGLFHYTDPLVDPRKPD